MVLSGFGFKTQKFFQTADSGVLSSKVLSNSGFGSFSQDSGCSFKFWSSSKLKSSFKQRIRVVLSGFGVFFQNSKGSSKVLPNGCRCFFRRMMGVLLNILEFFQMDVDAFFDGCRRFFRMKSSSKMDDGCSSNSS